MKNRRTLYCLLLSYVQSCAGKSHVFASFSSLAVLVILAIPCMASEIESCNGESSEYLRMRDEGRYIEAEEQRIESCDFVISSSPEEDLMSYDAMEALNQKGHSYFKLAGYQFHKISPCPWRGNEQVHGYLELSTTNYRLYKLQIRKWLAASSVTRSLQDDVNGMLARDIARNLLCAGERGHAMKELEAAISEIDSIEELERLRETLRIYKAQEK